MDINIDISNIVIETDQMILRSIAKTDLADFYAYTSIPGVGEMAGWQHHESIETSKRILDKFIAGKNVFALFHKADRKVIGTLGLHYSWANEDDRYKNYKLKRIGYILSNEYWGRGLMPEAVKAVVNYGFSELGIEAFSCEHFEENHQSRRVIEKCGFKFVEKSEYYAPRLQKSFVNLRYILLRTPEINVR